MLLTSLPAAYARKVLRNSVAAASIAAALRSAKDFAAAAKAQGLEAKDTELLARESAIPDIGVAPEVDKAAFAPLALLGADTAPVSGATWTPRSITWKPAPRARSRAGPSAWGSTASPC